MRDRLILTAMLMSPASLSIYLRSSAIQPLLTSEYSPRRALYLAHPGILWTNVTADALTAASYLLIFIGISWLVEKLKHIEGVRSYIWVFMSFKVFIAGCASTILLRVVNIWYPLAQFSLVLKIVCAATSLPISVAFALRAPSMAASIRRFFDHVVSEQHQSEALRKSQAFLDRTNRVAGVGGWEVDLHTSVVTWSEETRRIHGAPPGYRPTLEEGLSMYKPEARPIIAGAVEAASNGGGGWDLELPFTTLDGRDIWVRVVGEVELEDGRPACITGAFQDITARVAEREALKQANERVEIATESGGIGIWDWDILTGKLFCDAQMHRLHGKDPFKPERDELWRDHVHPDDKERVVKALGDAVAGIAPYDAQFRVVWQDGTVHTLRGAARVTRDEDGKAMRMVGANWDVTARVEAEDALRAANGRVALATDSGGIGIFQWDMLHDVCICDPWMYRLHNLEKTSDTTPLAFWTQHMHPDDKQRTVEALNDAAIGPDPYDNEYRVIWVDGSVHYLRGTGRIARDEKGHAVTMVGANWDVTDSRRLTLELAEQHELLRVTLLSIADGVITTDSRRNVDWLNPAAEEMTGWSTIEAAGRPLSDVFVTLNAETREPAANPIVGALAQGKAAGLARHTLLIGRNEIEYDIENAVSPIRNDVGDLLGNVLVFRDVTEQRRFSAETNRADKLQADLKLKDEFLSHVSHELRSPLTSIYSFTSIIADDLAGETTVQQKEFLQIILKNVVQLQAMIEDLLTVTQNRTGKLSIDLQSVSTSEAVADALNTVTGAASKKEISLSSNHHADLPDACADPTRLRQVLIILLDNAIKFTPSGGSVSASVSKKDEKFLVVQVTDTGCGIPVDKRTRIFENLYQVTGPERPDTSQAGRTGLGLGLHIARNLVTRQGGYIWVIGEPGQGSIFNFTIPIASADCSFGKIVDVTPRRRRTDWPVETVPVEARAAEASPLPISELTPAA